MKELITDIKENSVGSLLYQTKKIIDSAIKKDMLNNVKNDFEIKDILNSYCSKKYVIKMFVSGTKDPGKLLKNIIEYCD